MRAASGRFLCCDHSNVFYRFTANQAAAAQQQQCGWLAGCFVLAQGLFAQPTATALHEHHQMLLDGWRRVKAAKRSNAEDQQTARTCDT